MLWSDSERRTDMDKRIEASMEHIFGAGDLRLVYGITIPLTIGVGAIMGYMTIGAWWLLAPTMLALIALTLVVIWGVSQMADEQEPLDPID